VKKRPGPDAPAYDAAVAERARNVVIDAGAGTGKTTAIVERIVRLVQGGMKLSRIAAITFTRRAAGELKLRVRQELITARLTDALRELDNAYIGTIHSFCDRLLRLKPVEMELSPSYETVEDDRLLIDETRRILERESQRKGLGGWVSHERIAETEQTIGDFILAALPMASWKSGWAESHGLDALLEGFLHKRDVAPREADVIEPDLAGAKAIAKGMLESIGRLEGQGAAHRRFRDLGRALQEVLVAEGPIEMLKAAGAAAEIRPWGKFRFNYECEKDGRAWGMGLKWGWRGEPGQRDELVGPWASWMSARLVRTWPVVCALYEEVKRRRQTLDPLDLVLRLRDGLRRSRDLRAEYQTLFDHVLVDEFQDTDPAQMEIIFYLCERGATASTWADAVLAPGKLTIVGDWKQSIYRFRRADVEAYEQARGLMLKQGALRSSLTTNFRSRPELIAAFNDKFIPWLKAETLTAHSPARGQPCVRLVRYKASRAEEGRLKEAELLSRLIRGMHGVEVVRDPVTGGERPLQYRDVTVLARSTWEIPKLLDAFRGHGLPYSARGGRLFLSDSLVRRFLLALRAVADPSDGAAQAALFGPPFFAVDYGDLLSESAKAKEAHALISDLRKLRHSRPPSATARDLIERSGVGRFTALEPNGAQSLSLLWEVALEMDLQALGRGLDFDAVTAQMREWVEDPVRLDPPDPAGDAVRVMSIHQSKGLEYPVVILWDAQSPMEDSKDRLGAWFVRGDAWSVGVRGVQAHHPADHDPADDERARLNEERKRLYYVAATRARDLLIVPLTPEPWRPAANAELMKEIESHAVDAVVPELAPVDPVRAVAAEVDLTEWKSALAASKKPIAVPIAVTALADDAVDRTAKHEKGRHGPEFGTVVHAAIDALLGGSTKSAAELIKAAAASIGLKHHLPEAEADVSRALEAVKKLAAREMQTEVPIAMREGGQIVVGYIDCLAVCGEDVWVIDWKTDVPGQNAKYEEQLKHYARAVTRVGKRVRMALVFTQTGTMVEVGGRK